MRFEIFLEFQRSVFIREGAIPNKFPRLEFCGVLGFAGIVIRNPPLQIGGGASIFLVGKINTADDVDVPHRCSGPSSPVGLRRAPRFAAFVLPVAAPREARADKISESRNVCKEEDD